MLKSWQEKQKESLDERLAYLDYVTKINSYRAYPILLANSAGFKTQTISVSVCLLCSGITVIVNNCDSQLHFNEY